MSITSDTWLTAHLSSPAFKCSAPPPSPLTAGGFYYAKVDVSHVGQVVDFQKSGFYVVDTNVIWARPAHPAPPPKHSNDIEVSPATPQDAPAVMDIARNTFAYTRFHLDPAIPNSVADDIKAAWVGNFFSGKRGDALFVARRGGQVLGFNLVMYTDYDGYPSGIIDLIGVHPVHKRQGVGQALLWHFIEHLQASSRQLVVGTQISNIPSMRLYTNSGARIVHAQYVLHAHING